MGGKTITQGAAPGRKIAGVTTNARLGGVSVSPEPVKMDFLGSYFGDENKGYRYGLMSLLRAKIGWSLEY